MCGRFTSFCSPRELRKHFEASLPSCEILPNFNVAPTQQILAIEIGEGLTAFALSHHPAYGTVPGGSCSRYLRFVQIEEEKQALLSKETVR